MHSDRTLRRHVRILQALFRRGLARVDLGQLAEGVADMKHLAHSLILIDGFCDESPWAPGWPPKLLRFAAKLSPDDGTLALHQ